MSVSEEWFDSGAEREGTNCVKWDGRERIFGRKDIIPLWVADMDFRAPQEVTDTLLTRAAQGVFGYPDDESEALVAVSEWEKSRHGLSVLPERITLSPGVVDSLYFAVNTFTEAGDQVAVQTPVYGPFMRAVEDTGRRIWYNRLICDETGWRMDLDQLEEGLKRGVKLLLLCSPHNPVSRIWTEEELRAVSELCERYGARIVADEIHGDLEMPGYRHTPLLKINENAICLVSATKTFNLAGLRCSSILFGSEKDQRDIEGYMKRAGVGEINIFGTMAQTAAYRSGASWLDALLEYLSKTSRMVRETAKERMPRFSFSEHQGTYLMWMDLRAAGLTPEELEKRMVFEAGVGCNSGTFFGEEGGGFMRLNIATPRKNVLQALEKIADTFSGI